MTGVASLLLSFDPELNPAQVKRLLRDTALDLGQPGCDRIYGCGLVNAFEALKAAGAQTSQDPRLGLSSDTLNFGPLRSTLDLALFNLGGGSLEVDPAQVSTQQGTGWLSASMQGATLQVSVVRTSLPQGRYQGLITIASNGGDAEVEVQMQVGGFIDNPGTFIVAAIDPTTLRTQSQTFTILERDYLFNMPPMEAGEYFLVAGTDRDRNLRICEPGELCGIYPVLSKPSLIRVQPNLDSGGIVFSLRNSSSQGSGIFRRGVSVGPVRKAPQVLLRPSR